MKGKLCGSKLQRFIFRILIKNEDSNRQKCCYVIFEETLCTRLLVLGELGPGSSKNLILFLILLGCLQILL